LAYQKAIADEANNTEEDETIMPDDMLDDETLEYMKNGLKKDRKRKHADENDDDKIEKSYKRKDTIDVTANDSTRLRKCLLPIKTKTGLVKQYMDIAVQEDGEKERKSKKTEKTNEREGAAFEHDLVPSKTGIELVIEQQALIESTKIKIGLLSHGIMENPQEEV
jgi:hypothetical protein